MARKKSSSSGSRSSKGRSSGSSKKKSGGSKKSSNRKYSRGASKEVEKEMRHRKQGKHGKMSKKQAVAIGLSKARRKGKKVPDRPSAS